MIVLSDMCGRIQKRKEARSWNPEVQAALPEGDDASSIAVKNVNPMVFS